MAAHISSTRLVTDLVPGHQISTLSYEKPATALRLRLLVGLWYIAGKVFSDDLFIRSPTEQAHKGEGSWLILHLGTWSIRAPPAGSRQCKLHMGQQRV